MPPTTRTSRTSMWLVFLVLGAVILAAIAFSVDRSSSVVDTAPAAPEATETPDATATVPAEPAPATGGDATTGETTGGTTDGISGGTTGDTTGTGTTTSP